MAEVARWQRSLLFVPRYGITVLLPKSAQDVAHSGCGQTQSSRCCTLRLPSNHRCARYSRLKACSPVLAVWSSIGRGKRCCRFYKVLLVVATTIGSKWLAVDRMTLVRSKHELQGSRLWSDHYQTPLHRQGTQASTGSPRSVFSRCLSPLCNADYVHHMLLCPVFSNPVQWRSESSLHHRSSKGPAPSTGLRYMECGEQGLNGSFIVLLQPQRASLRLHAMQYIGQLQVKHST